MPEIFDAPLVALVYEQENYLREKIESFLIDCGYDGEPIEDLRNGNASGFCMEILNRLTW